MFYLMLCNYSKEVEKIIGPMIHAGKIEYPEKFWISVDAGAKNLCELILQYDPAKRISAGEIQTHPWLHVNLF